jgi:hypothetical protein
MMNPVDAALGDQDVPRDVCVVGRSKTMLWVVVVVVGNVVSRLEALSSLSGLAMMQDVCQKGKEGTVGSNVMKIILQCIK